jgi:hypothetical protein
MVQTPDQGQENAIVNRALTKVPRPHITGIVLGKDIKLGTLQLNAIDDNDVVWVCTDIKGWWNLPDTEVQDLDKGWGDGGYNSKGRYRSRILELEGVILPPDASKVQSARDTLVRALDLVRDTVWLVVNESDYTKAVKVRISGKPNIENTNARGRIQFNVGLVAVDPIKYQWFGDATTTDYAETPPKNSTGTQDGYVTINNKGNYPVGAVYEIEGPIVSGGATIFNETNGDLLTITDTTRGKMYRFASAKSMANGVANITTTVKTDLVAGDEIEITLPQTFNVTNFAVSSLVATFTANATHNFSVGDVFAVSNVHANVNGVELTVASTPAHNTFTASTTSGNITSVAVTGTVENITNKKLNGTFPVTSVVNNNLSFTYVTEYNDSITNVAQTYDNASPTVFRDADILEIDTSNREVAFNGDASQKRGMLDAVVDWVKLEDGNNLVQFEDSGAETFWITRYSVASSGSTNTDTINFYTTNAHGYTTSDSVTVDNVTANVNTNLSKTINQFSSNANVVTANITAHGYSSTDYVVVSGVSNVIDGLYSVTNVNANAITFTTTASGTSYNTVAPDGATARKVSKVSSFSRTGNVVTTIANAHGFYTNDAVYFTGLSNVVDGLYIVTNVNANALSYVTRTTGTIASANTANGYAAVRYLVTDEDTYRIQVAKRPNTASVSETGIGAIVSTDNVGEIGVSSITINNSSNTITIATAGEHGFAVGENLQIVAEDSSSGFMDKYAVATGYPIRVKDWKRAATGVVTVNTVTALNSATFAANNYVTISNVDASVDGTYQIATSVNATNYTINTQNTIVVTQTNVDNAYMKRLHKIVYYTRNKGNSSSTVIESVASYTQSTNVLTVTTNLAHTIAVTDNVILFDVKDELDYRPYTVTAVTSKTFTVNVNYSATDSNTKSIGGYFNTSKDTYLANTTGNVVYLAFDTAHGLANGESISISGLSSSIDGTHKVVFTNSSIVNYFVDSNSLREDKASSNVRRTSGSTTATVVTTENHGFTVGDSIYVVGAGAVGDMDGQWVMYSNVNAKAFTYISGSNTTINVNTTTRIFSSPVDNYAEEVFPIVSKTNTTFSYYHPTSSYTTATITGTASTGNTTITASNTDVLYIGQAVSRVAGAAMANTFISTVINATAFTVVTAPTGSGAITLVVSGESPQTLTETPGKIVKNSDGTMRVYFKSGWIG